MEENAIVENATQLISAKDSLSILSNGGLNVNALRTNAVLRKDEWEQLDTTIVDVSRQRLNVVEDLRSAGLVQNLGGLGTTISQYEKQSDMSAATLDMDAETAETEDRVTYTLVETPVPIIHKGFRINVRVLEASRKLGQSLDVVQAAVAARKVADAIESLVFNGSTAIVVNGGSIPGLTNQSDVNTASGSDWGTIANIYDNVNSAVSANEADYFFGPFTLYVAATQFGQMRAIYTDGSGESAYERVLRGIPSITAVKPSDVLTAGTAVLVQMTRDVVDLAVGLDTTVVEWETRGGMSFHFKVMAAMAPRVKSDAGNRSGICLLSGI